MHDSPAALPLYLKAGFHVYDVKDQLELYLEEFARSRRDTFRPPAEPAQ